MTPSSSTTEKDITDIERARTIRRRIVQTAEACRKGHLGAAMSLVEIMQVLFDDILRYDPLNPHWPLRDRFVLSKGHGCLALYVLLADKGFFDPAFLCDVYSPGCILGGHPERGKVPGVEVSTGSLGHGLSVSIGFALNARMEKSAVRTFTIIGDGECNEGAIWEAAMCAAQHNLDNLCVLVDRNRFQSYGPAADILGMEPFAEKWASFGFAVREVNGHDQIALRNVLTTLPFASGKPSVVICHTVKGKGIPFMENNPTWHHRGMITDDEIKAMFAALGES